MVRRTYESDADKIEYVDDLDDLAAIKMKLFIIATSLKLTPIDRYEAL